MVGQAQPYYGIDQDINSCNGFSFAGLYFDENICPITPPPMLKLAEAKEIIRNTYGKN